MPLRLFVHVCSLSIVCFSLTLSLIDVIVTAKSYCLHKCMSLFFVLAAQAMKDGKSPVIIDNTNLKKWEMEPYAQMVSLNSSLFSYNFRQAFL